MSGHDPNNKSLFSNTKWGREFSSAIDCASQFFLAVVASFLSVGLLACFLEYFYIHSNDWGRVLRATVVLGSTHVIITSIMNVVHNSVHSHAPDPLHDISALVLAFSWAFWLTTGFAVFSLIFVSPLVFFISLLLAVTQDGATSQISGREILHWSILVSYFWGGVVGLYSFLFTVYDLFDAWSGKR